MKDKLIFRIIGSLASSLIILSVFMPFATSDVMSIWNLNNGSDMIYLPIMIIAYGVIGVIFFALNYKTEFAYATSGAITFFSGTQLIQAISFNTVDKLGLGFYLIATSGIIVGIMAFVCNLKSKKEVEENKEPSKERLDNDFISSENINDSQNILNQTFDTQQVPISNSNIGVAPINPELSNIEMKETSIPELPEEKELIQPSLNVDMPQINNQMAPIPEIGQQNLNVSSIDNLDIGIENEIKNNSSIPEIAINPISTEEVKKQDLKEENVPKINPVLQEFTNSQNTQPQTTSFTSPTNSNPINTLNNTSQQTTTNNSNMQGLDIFGNF